MIRPIVHMETFLRRPSSEASVEDLPLAQDLIDTLNTHRDACVGMAANMIGALKRVIVFVDETGAARVLFNPRLVEGTGAYRTREGCLGSEWRVIGSPQCLSHARGLPLACRRARDEPLLHDPRRLLRARRRRAREPRRHLAWLRRRDHPARDRPLRRGVDLT